MNKKQPSNKLNKSTQMLLGMPSAPHKRPVPTKEDLKKVYVMRAGKLIERKKELVGICQVICVISKLKPSRSAA